MYVCTVSLPDLNWLIRTDVYELGGNMMAEYTRIDAKGIADTYTCPIGPDQYDVGMPTIAIIALVRDLNWCGIEGHIHVVHHGALDQDDLLDILQQVHPVYALRNLTTTGRVQ